jgi:hypothetical protein
MSLDTTGNLDFNTHIQSRERIEATPISQNYECNTNTCQIGRSIVAVRRTAGLEGKLQGQQTRRSLHQRQNDMPRPI